MVALGRVVSGRLLSSAIHQGRRIRVDSAGIPIWSVQSLQLDDGVFVKAIHSFKMFVNLQLMTEKLWEVL